MADVSRSVHQGVGSGLLAGATFAAAQVIAAVTGGIHLCPDCAD